MKRSPSLFGIIYLIIGLFIAYSHGYLAATTSLGGLLSALLAVLLWPLILFGIHFTIGL